LLKRKLYIIPRLTKMEIVGSTPLGLGAPQRRVNLAVPFSIWIQPTKRSNLGRSLLAYDVPDPSCAELSTQEIEHYLSELFDRGLNAAFIEGGEPLVREDWGRILRFVTEHAFTMFRTNGTLIDDRIADEIAGSRVGLVCVDIEGGLPHTHDYLVGLDGAFDRSVAAVRRLVRRGVRTFVTTILTRNNASELQRLLDLTAELGAEKLGVLRLYPLGRARENWGKLSISLEDQMKALDKLVVPSTVKLMQSWHPYDPNCCWQISAVDAYGNNIGCPYLRDFAFYGNVRNQSVLESWSNPRYVAIRSAEVHGACSSCSDNDPNAAGGCRSTAYAFSGKWDAPDPYCSHMNEGTDLTVLPDWLQNLGRFGPPVEDHKA
jgi:radical SAM protein with 4Fe4S-binding SPASM domain